MTLRCRQVHSHDANCFLPRHDVRGAQLHVEDFDWILIGAFQLPGFLVCQLVVHQVVEIRRVRNVQGEDLRPSGLVTLLPIVPNGVAYEELVLLLEDIF